MCIGGGGGWAGEAGFKIGGERDIEREREKESG